MLSPYQCCRPIRASNFPFELVAGNRRLVDGLWVVGRAMWIEKITVGLFFFSNMEKVNEICEAWIKIIGNLVQKMNDF